MSEAAPLASLDVRGRCHCGAVQLTATVIPAKVFVCHCTDCQVLTGSAFRVVVPAVPGSMKVEGEVKEYARMAESGAVRLQAFCPACGTPLFARSESADGLATLRVGALAERHQLKPSAQLWRRSALSWVNDLGGIPACEQQALLG